MTDYQRQQTPSLRENYWPGGWLVNEASWGGASVLDGSWWPGRGGPVQGAPFAWSGSDRPLGFRGDAAGTRLAAVERARGLIADSLAGVPWQVYRGRVQQPTPSWLWDPMGAQNDGRATVQNPMGLTGVQFWSWIVSDMLLDGEAFLYAENLDDANYPLAPLRPIPVSMVEDVGFTGIGLTSGKFIPSENVIHLRGKPPYVPVTDHRNPKVEGVGFRGVGVLRRHAHTLGLAGAVGAYAQNTFRTGVPSGYLKATQPGLTPDDAEKLAERWMEKHGQARQVAVLGNTVEFVPINLSPVDAELVKMQDFSLREIAHAFGMSAHYLDVVGATGTYANVQDRAVDFRQFTLLPWARLIESELDTRLPAGTGLRLRLDGLERGTTGQRYDDYGKALAGGWLTVDEIRELEGLPPLEGGSDV